MKIMLSINHLKICSSENYLSSALLLIILHIREFNIPNKDMPTIGLHSSDVAKENINHENS